MNGFKFTKWISLTSVLAGALLVWAQDDAGKAKQQVTLDDLAWMAGTWVGNEHGMEMEEVWLAPKGGLMLGLHRDVSSRGGKAQFEFLRIESGPKGIAYLASPGGRPATAFALLEVEDEKVVFENLQHDFPKRILYWKDGEDGLSARVEGDATSKEQPLEFHWRRAETCK